MRIAIVGLGVAGSYLASTLSKEHEVTGYDRLPIENFDAVCAWGTTKSVISELVKPSGLDFENYVMHDGREMIVDASDERIHIKLKGLCIYDKLSLTKDMAKGQKVHFGKYVNDIPNKEDYDIIIDSTGLTRPLLPRIKDDVLIPSLQYKVKYRERPFDDFYIKPFPGLGGYFWYFPLENGYAHVGAGDIHKRHIAEIETFFNKFPCEKIHKVGRPVRITPPALCQPFSQGKVVGVGESIGTVHPMLGEGIIPSLQCARLLVENIHDLKAYESRVKSHFRAFEKVYRLVKAKLDNNFSLRSQFPNLLYIFLYMKRNENRYGLQVKLRDMIKIMSG